MQILSALIAGLLFGFGLLISGMSNPSKVLNFLDLFGAFDASLLFVMMGAVVTSFIGYRLLFQKARPLYGEVFHKPTSQVIDARLIAGSVIFGIGWGMVGLCPGPALVSLSIGGISAIIFALAMLIGISVAKVLFR